jgi:hypothetical protein
LIPIRYEHRHLPELPRNPIRGHEQMEREDIDDETEQDAVADQLPKLFADERAQVASADAHRMQRHARTRL